MRILGLDPGTATVGYGIVEEDNGQVVAVGFGVITTSPEDATGRRLQIIYQELDQLLARYRPDAAAIEEVFFGRNITTAISVGQARGVLLLALANAGIPVAEYSPPKIKEAVSGYGKASKEQVQFMVQNMLALNEIPRPDDAADGLAVALTHYQYQRYESLARLE
ncbi:MAG: crossover junction endodeoxyribonuclease RuvC [Chloroflexi bacterium]|nr:crossover junction endodeoxyribonuclease RuvC [Chloroflexota bacterium]MCI0643999.1 crossover junction endodeoxyribonuclease RuvC [Chloroflexota bacterium]MCI0732002.1 crossover junction endodeoxyribonuclease RuvC [Chloroflexota bacterium]